MAEEESEKTGRGVEFAVAAEDEHENAADEKKNLDNENLDEIKTSFPDSETPATASTDKQAKKFSDESTMERVERRCCPYGLPKQVVSLALCFLALVLTFAGSWDCSYFEGASISFTGNRYGLWTIEDYSGKCQLWDVIFFAYDLGGPLRTARAFSMISMTLGLGLLTTMMQAVQLHVMSWSFGVGIVVLLIVSIATTSIFNMWILFWLFSYIIYVLIVRALFIHPVHRRISRRGSKIIASLHIICALCCFLTTVVFASDFCTCDNLTSEELEGRDPGDPCSSSCAMRTAGILTMVAAVMWILTAVATVKLGIQPQKLRQSESVLNLYAYYPRSSITTRVMRAAGGVKRAAGGAVTAAGEASDTFGEHVSGAFRKAQDNNETSETGDAEKDDARADSGGDLNNGEEATEVKRDEDEDEDEDEKDSRSCCQKFCYDYRVVPRSGREKVLFWMFRFCLVVLFVVYVYIVLLLIGSRVESTRAAKASDTTAFFTTDTVCAFDPEDPYQPFVDFPTKEEANDAGYLVAHCGGCGFCSNPDDIKTYVQTRKTVAKKSKECGPKVILGTYNALVSCLEGKIGLSRDCTKCWADNLKTTASKCIFTCMTTLIQGFMGNNNVPGAGEDGWLNKCLFCDERRSGPGFVTCSGVARRRLGIQSEIERNPEQQCKNNDVDWVTLDWDAIFPSQ